MAQWSLPFCTPFGNSLDGGNSRLYLVLLPLVSCGAIINAISSDFGVFFFSLFLIPLTLFVF